MSQGHSASCADAVRTTTAECKCTCGGDFHGGPHSERVRALVWNEENRSKYSKTQVARAKRKARDALAAGTSIGEACTDFAVTQMVDELILMTEPNEQQLAREVLKALIQPFVDEVASADLDEDDATRIETAVNNLHILCALCVEVLRLIDQATALADQAAEDIAAIVVDSLGEHSFLTNVVKQVLTKSLAQSFHAVIALAADPAKIKMLEVVGFASCPNIADHPEVEKYCIAPLTKDYVTEALHDWIDSGFPEDAAILRRAPRGKKTA